MEFRTALAFYSCRPAVSGGRCLLTGKQAQAAQAALGGGDVLIPAAVLWAGAQQRMEKTRREGVSSLAVIDLSASGYCLVGVETDGSLKDDTLITHPRCGAGSGLNLDRVLEKLGLQHDQVDRLLEPYLGEPGSAARSQVPVRADRCGVFSASATISDKNQGLPLSLALAATLKSEVWKVCGRLPSGFEEVWLTGGVFRWRFARDCAADRLAEGGTLRVRHDADTRWVLSGMQRLAALPAAAGNARPRLHGPKTAPAARRESLGASHADLVRDGLLRRLAPEPLADPFRKPMVEEVLALGLDVGSTMAKLAIADARTGALLHVDAVSNAGDTIETVKLLFERLARRAGSILQIRHAGVTGSARYQVREALAHCYPGLSGRIGVRVENAAHARGALRCARTHLKWLAARGAKSDTQRFVLVDVGGEDTKISVVDLSNGRLLDNAMNTKCSAGTGSLMDTLSARYRIGDVAEAYRRALLSPYTLAINATCAVFLVESAHQLVAEGHPVDALLGSTCRAIAENMARGLWNRIELPKRALALLHGQTMLSDALPTAVMERLQAFTGTPMWGLIPPHPGHRACLGLIEEFRSQAPEGRVALDLDLFIGQRYERRLIVCRGLACGDKAARCHRTALSGHGPDGARLQFTLGGCTAVNDRLSRRGRRRVMAPDAYRSLKTLAAAELPRSDDARRLVIPRALAVSEWMPFFAALFGKMGLPVYVDEVREEDLKSAQQLFRVDACAPHLGVVGQILRLAKEPHGAILAPQIEFLPVDGCGLARTCTVNQGAFAVAKALAEQAHPEAFIHLFHMTLGVPQAPALAPQLAQRLAPLLARYGKSAGESEWAAAAETALAAQRAARKRLADRAAEFARQAVAQDRPVVIVLGREYVLNPGLYDSHVGRLLRDKNICALPGDLLDLEPNPEFEFLYWRNAERMAGIAAAAARGELHRRVRHAGLRAAFARIETRGGSGVPVVQVSTFLCGPDSVTAPLIAELTQEHPFLLLQSDAALKELAHLENRVQTFASLLGRKPKPRTQGFSPASLAPMVAADGLNAETDVLYFPTMRDNRAVTAIVRAAGFTCLDTYRDDSYDLAALIRRGREAAGEAVCAPLAAVYGDVLGALEDFGDRRRRSDPAVAGKTRVLVFNNKGAGPCRQGQYVELHKLLAHRRRAMGEQSPAADLIDDETVFRFAVAHENRAFDIGLGEWATLHGLRAVALHGVLDELLLQGGSRCRDAAQFERFRTEHRALKERIFALQERRSLPGPGTRRWVEAGAKIPGLGLLVKYYAYGMPDRALRRELKTFAGRWPALPRLDGAVRVFVTGEVYMRVAQLESVFEGLLALMGFGRVEVGHAPALSYLDYVLAGMRMRAREALHELRGRLHEARDAEARHAIRGAMRAKRRRLATLAGRYALLRRVLAAPLYRAAGLKPPPPISDLLEVAKEVLPTRRPGGELPAYVGEALYKLRKGYDLVLNVAPEGCMVCTMGEALTPALQDAAGVGRIQPIFSNDGSLRVDHLGVALLKTLGPERCLGAARNAKPRYHRQED
jgi:activator of 2-hydroxyglutaryl-CoA dehydratase/predicted nucleotide-binding protein (sugar kinase/HSP70/actin superfamily)